MGAHPPGCPRSPARPSPRGRDCAPLIVSTVIESNEESERPLSRLDLKMRPERQRLRVRAVKLVCSGEDFVPRPIGEILAIADIRRSEWIVEDREAPSTPLLAPFATADRPPPEREMFPRAFSGASIACWRKAVRTWRHQIRHVCEQIQQGHSRLNPGPDTAEHQQGRGLVALMRGEARVHFLPVY